MCFEGIVRLSHRVWRRFVRGSREISLVPSLHRASTDALIYVAYSVCVQKPLFRKTQLSHTNTQFILSWGDK